MKLNGWKRIGIVASVIWILAAGARTEGVESDAVVQAASALTISCEQAQNMRWSAECDARSTDYLAENLKYAWIDAAIVAFVPVPLGWGLAYLVLFLVRWIKLRFA